MRDSGDLRAPRVLRACVVVGLLATAGALVALPARATYGARTTADEPQYLLSALSIWEDGDLNVADELAAERWRDFHEAQLPVQTEPLPDGREVSPHDPLLPVLLAVPVGIAGWAGAKAMLAVLAGVLAGLLVWVAHRRFAVPVLAAGVTVGAFALSAPLTSYGTQVYPELPAALAVTVAVAAATGPLDRKGRWAFGLAVVALPWLAVKYVPVAAALVAVTLWRLLRERGPSCRLDAPDSGALGRHVHVGIEPDPSCRLDAPVSGTLGRHVHVGIEPDPSCRLDAPVSGTLGRHVDVGGGPVRLAGGLALAGVVYVVAHRMLYGGWTVYAAGDHFVGGESTAIGHNVDLAGRTRRLLGLLVDRGFGLAAWAPVWLLGVPAFAALARRRPPGSMLLAVPLAAGWATATWVALTMHGWWWPGRQVVVVAPLVVLGVAWWVGQLRRPALVPFVVALGAAGVLLWGWLVAEVLGGDLRLIIDFEATADPLARLWRLALPEMRSPTAGDWLRYAAWAAALALAARAGWRSVAEPAPDPRTTTQETHVHVKA